MVWQLLNFRSYSVVHVENVLYTLIDNQNLLFLETQPPNCHTILHDCTAVDFYCHSVRQEILSTIGKFAIMATKLVYLLISSYLLLAGDYHVVSGFTPVTYSSKSSSTECGQSDPLQDDQLTETLSKIHQELRCNPPQNRSCQEILHCFPSAPSCRLPRDTCSQWLTSTGLL